MSNLIADFLNFLARQFASLQVQNSLQVLLFDLGCSRRAVIRCAGPNRAQALALQRRTLARWTLVVVRFIRLTRLRGYWSELGRYLQTVKHRGLGN